MKLKRMVRYRADISSKWADLSAALMGAAFFLHACYYFAARELASCSAGEIVFGLILPLVGAAAWIALLRLIPQCNVKVYAFCAAALCLIFALQGFYTDNLVMAVLAFVWYLIMAVTAIFVCFGYLPYRILLSVVMLLPAALRVLIVLGVYIFPGKYWQGLSDYAVILMLLSLTCLSGMLQSPKKG